MKVFNESFDNESNISDVYVSDADPKYRSAKNNNTYLYINSAGPSHSFRLPSAYPSDDESFFEYWSDGN